MTMHIKPLIAAAHARQQRLSNAYLRRITALFQSISQAPESRLSAGFIYAKLVLIWWFLRREVHIAALVVLLLAFSTGMFIPPETIDVFTRLIIVGGAMILGSGVAIATSYLTLPLHIWCGARLWSMGCLHIALSALLFCSIDPIIFFNLWPYGMVPDFADLFIPAALLFAITDAFILWQTHLQISFHEYQAHHQAGRSQTAKIESLLPAEKRGEIQLMSAADHYVEIFTDKGQHMQRITMKAAVEKTRTVDGLRVHRSHWVAYSAMLSLEKNGERFMLTLRNGQQIPVSTKSLPAVRGYLEATSQQAAE